RFWSRAVQWTGRSSVFEGQPENPHDVLDVDPAHPLIAVSHQTSFAADRHARPQLEDRSHQLERTLASCQNDPGPHDPPADAGGLELCGNLFALAADHRQKITARWACFVEDLVTCWPIKPDCRAVDQNSGT